MDTLSLLRRYCENGKIHEVKITQNVKSETYSRDGEDAIVVFGSEYAFSSKAHTALLDKQMNFVDLRAAVVFAQNYIGSTDDTATKNVQYNRETCVNKHHTAFVLIFYCIV